MPKEARVWYRWSRFIQHRPWPAALGATAVLLLLAIPLFSIRLGFGDYGNYPEDTTVRRAYDLLAEGFGPGTNGPLFITVEGEEATDEAALGAVRRRRQRPRTSPPPFPTPINDGLALVIVNPESAPQDAETIDARQHVARRRHPGVGPRRQGRRVHGRVHGLLGATSVTACRCSSASSCCSASSC